MCNFVCHYKANICQIPVLSEVSLGLRQKFLCRLRHWCVRGRLQDFRAENGRSGLGGKGKRSEEFEFNLSQRTGSSHQIHCHHMVWSKGGTRRFWETSQGGSESIHLGSQLKSDRKCSLFTNFCLGISIWPQTCKYHDVSSPNTSLQFSKSPIPW